ncbi:MAG: phosphodiester glycosidase family protein [Oscillospiraceae bacterium]|nr:phosphodiester glycosidase family protein [Oscillospiraceae bacterium]
MNDCADADLDHDCDECNAEMGEHDDGDLDHKCDYGCSEPIGTHEDTNRDHVCDYGCSVAIGEHADSDKNHSCDHGCSASIGNHTDADGDGNHSCDYCGEIMTECEDADKDHTCDECDTEVGDHADSENDGNHVCDYCGQTMTECVDSNTDKDHACDECGKDGITDHQWVDANCTTPKKCSVCGLTDGAALDHDMTQASCSAPATCKRENCGYTVGQALPHTPVADEGYPAFCEETGLTDGSHCSVCGTTLVKQEIIPALGHDIQYYEAKQPTYSSVGWEAYEACTRCAYTTYVEIPALEAPVIETYEDFLFNLALLEEIAYAYIQQNPGKDPANLVIKYIRTGVDRYNSGSWGIMAGYEDAGFAAFVSEMEDMINSQAADESEMICVTAMKNIENFTIPNGDYVDFGHMFGTMDITYHNTYSVNHADVAGWAGDLVDLLSTADRHAVKGTMDEMVADISENYLNKSLGENDIFSLTDTYGDLDGFYVMKMLQGKTYETGMLTEIIQGYFTEELTDEYRADFFLKNRLNGVSTRGDIRDAVYNAYTSNKVVATLEGTREFTSDNLDDLKKACSYAFADYLCKLAGDYVEVTDNPYYSVFSSSASTLAPGITQKIEMATSADGKQMVYYLATADLSRDDVHIFANYNNNDPAAGWAMQRVLDQAKAAQAKYGDPNSEHYIPNYNVIASINGAGFNMSTGEPSGLLIMNGVVYQDINASGFFGILKDGTAVIGTKDEYLTVYKDQVAEGIAGFGTTLVQDGAICITRTDSYYSDRASRTAVGITRTGKVVFMVLDGRQEPWSCGGSMEEIAQIMLEAGCVHAINLDGGGSTTFVAKQEGDDSLSVVNRPSDGVERSVSTSLLMVSTAPSSTAFDHAILETETDYVTVGTSIQITPAGVSATGNAAEVPEGVTWAVSNEKWGTITEDGVFTALRNGDVDIYLMLGDEIIGTKTIHIVLPNQVYFTKTNINAVYGQSITLPVKALYDGKEVAIQPSDLIFTMNNEVAGIIDGFNFIGDEASGVKMVVVTVTLASDTSVSANATVNLYKQGENSFDFDQATGGDRELAWDRQVSNATTDDAITYMIIDQSKDMVTSYVFAIDMTQIPIPKQLEDLIYMLPGSDMEGASAWNFLLQLAERVSVLSEVKPVIRFDPNFDVDYSELKLVNEYFVLTATEFDEQTNSLTLTLNWIDQTQPIDPTMANPLCLVSGIKLTPKENANWDAKSQLTVVNSGEISYEIYLRASGLYSFAQKPDNQQTYGLYPYINPNDANDKGGYFGDIYHTFVDTYTLVNAVKNGWLNEDGGFAYYNNGEKYFGVRKVDGLYYNFGENGINIGKTTYSGLFEENGSTYYAKNGELVIGWQAIGDDWYLFNETTYAGVHGTYSAVVANVAVTYEMENGRLVKGFWHENEKGLQYFFGPNCYHKGWKVIDGERYFFEDYYAHTGIHPVRESHAVTLLWYEFAEDGRLIGEVADGLHWFEGELYYIVDIIAVSNGMNLVDGNYYYFNANGTAVRNKATWVSKTNNLVEVGTYRFAADGKAIMKTELAEENGALYYYHNGKRTASAGVIEWNGNYYYIGSGAKAIMGGTAWVSKTNGLCDVGTYRFAADGKMIMTTEVVNENGTYYYYCNGKRTASAGLICFNGEYYYIDGSAKAVVNRTVWISKTNGWKPVGSYSFDAEGKMIRHNGVVNGYYYVDGVKTAAGLVEFNGSYYYAGSGGKVIVNKSSWISTTNGLVSAGVYRFDAEGKMLLTTGVVNESGTLYYYQDGKRTNGGLVEYQGNYYYFANNGTAFTNGTAWVSKTNGLVAVGTYRFAADGKMIMTTEVVNENGTYYYYKDGKRTANAGLILFKDYYYYIDGSAKAVANKTIWVSKTNGLVPAGTYTFGAEGKMYLHHQILNGYYYYDGEKTAAGVVEINGSYYYAGNNGLVYTSRTFWAGTTNGLLEAGTYRAAADGKLIMTTEVVNENGTLYYYKNGKRTANAGVMEIDGSYYYIGSGAIAVAGRTAWVGVTNGLVPAGTYRFAADGKMIMTTEIVNENGALYYYQNGVRTASAGLIQLNGAYYYIDSSAKAVAGKTAWVSKTNGLVKEGQYTFDEKGKMIFANGIMDGYYYVDGAKTAAGLIQIDGSYYYAGSGGKILKNQSIWVSNTNDLLPVGTYRVDQEGKLIMTTELVNENGTLYYYKDGKRTANAGILEIDGSYYYVTGRGIAVANDTAWVSITNGLVPVGTYRFDADGKMIMTTEVVNEDGILYYYRNGVRTTSAGLIELDGDYYYIDSSAQAVVSKTVWVSITNGLMEEGSYTFGEDGKMIL